jgi:hypothetical protein
MRKRPAPAQEEFTELTAAGVRTATVKRCGGRSRSLPGMGGDEPKEGARGDKGRSYLHIPDMSAGVTLNFTAATWRSGS